ncbi:MAG: hypothetical protein J6X55_17420 [Victivallales bacterium]|nr:hypothetical protein [Victivallales bacterium]
MFCHCLPKLICLFLLSFISLNAQTVGASMALEGRAAVARAAVFLVSHQNDNGSWLDNPPLTSLSAQALLAANSYLDSDDIAIPSSKALAYVRISPTESDWHEAIRIRLLLETSSHTDRNTLSKALSLLLERPLPPNHAAVWHADALAICSRRVRPNTPVENALTQLATLTPTSHAEQLALAIATGVHTETSLKTLYASARSANCYQASISDLYWAARAFQACNAANAFPYDNWKADIIAALLDRQRGDGSWSAKDQPEPTILQNTALAIQTIIICLGE